jgi:hypothetical protein
MNNAGVVNDRLQAINTHYESLIGPPPWPGDLTLSDQIDLNVNYKNLSIVGEEDDKGRIIVIGLAAFGASSGDFEAKNCDLMNVFDGINPHVFCGENSVATIKNCKIKNVLTGSYSFLTSSYDIKNNVISNVGQIGLQLYTNNAGLTYNMPENQYSAIKENKLQMNSSNLNAPAIFGVRMNHVDVHENEITGTCGVGITAWGGFSDFCDDWSIKNNVMCDLVLTHTGLPAGTTIELNNALNCVVKDNWNQVVGGASAADPSNNIGEGVECDD